MHQLLGQGLRLGIGQISPLEAWVLPEAGIVEGDGDLDKDGGERIFLLRVNAQGRTGDAGVFEGQQQGLARAVVELRGLLQEAVLAVQQFRQQVEGRQIGS